MTLAEIYDTYNIGSDGFCRAVETHCGFEISRKEIARIAKRAATPEEFEKIWYGADWWTNENNMGRAPHHVVLWGEAGEIVGEASTEAEARALFTTVYNVDFYDAEDGPAVAHYPADGRGCFIIDGDLIA